MNGNTPRSFGALTSRITLMKLYYMPGAYSLASHIALHWAELDHEAERLTHESVHGQAFLSINPKGAVPALVLDDGAVITESLAVLKYIADMGKDSSLGADSPIEWARRNERLAGLVSDVHKAWGPVFAPQRYTLNAANHDDVRQAAFVQLDKQYDRMNAQLGGKAWSLFDRKTVADAYLYVMCRWKDNSPTKLASYPALAAFKARLDVDPGVRLALEVE